MNVKNILVTGGFGILGRSLIKQLLVNKKNKVFLLDRSSNKKKISTLNINNKNLKVIRGDFKNYKVLLRLIKKKKIGTIFHLGEEEAFSTIEFKINFVSAPKKDALLCKATIVHNGRTTQVWDAEVVEEETSRVLAHYRCTQIIMRSESI